MLGMQKRGNESLHSLQGNELGTSSQHSHFTPTVRALRPELMNKLCRQQSAPSIFYSYADSFQGNSDHTPEAIQSLSGSSRSLYAASEHTEGSYRSRTLEEEEEHYNEMLSVPTNIISNKRRAFAGMNRHQSMRSVMEEPTQSPEWLNRSCPNLMASLYEPNSVDFNTVGLSTSMFPVGRPDVIIEENAQQCVGSPHKGSNQVLNVKNHEEFLLSPIGDGSVDGLFKILQGMDAECDSTDTDDMFEPLPF